MARLPDKLPFTKQRLRPRIIISYILDYVILIACIAGFYIIDSIEPYHQHFSLRNISLQYPYAVHERISINWALVISGVIPLAIIAFYTLLLDGLFSHHKPTSPMSGKRKLMGPYRMKDRLWEFNCGFLGLLLSQAVAFVITQGLKSACGKPRPDIIDRCKPREGSVDLIPGLSNYTICTGDPHIIKDGFRSWPSGHSSSSFAGLFYLTLWLSGKLHLWDNRGEVWKMAIIVTPCIGATLVAVSRIMDARHHPFDVITGSLLGVVCAFLSYRQYFPPLSEPWKKGRAYPIRSWGSEPVAPYAPSESTANLRNPDDERLDVPGLAVTSGPTTTGPSAPTYTTGSNPYAGSNPYTASNPYADPHAANVYHHRSRGDDGNWSSSSEDDVADGYEMQHGYNRTQNPGLDGSLPRYAADTAYPGPQATTSGMGVGMGISHAVPRSMTTTPEHLHGGRTVTDVPARNM